MADRFEPTEEQKRVINTDVSAVVAAGAGSGKTTVLARRFVRLVVEKETPVEKILTLTFTKKATNEMFERIYRFLAEEKETAGPRETALLEKALGDFYKARIETLDAYCAAVVRSAPSGTGLSPDFAEDMERAAAIVAEESEAFLLKHRENPVIKALYPEKTPEQIAHDVFAATIEKHCFLGNPVDFIKDFEHFASQVITGWEKTLSALDTALQTIEAAQHAAAEKIRKAGVPPLVIPVIPDIVRGGGGDTGREAVEDAGAEAEAEAQVRAWWVRCGAVRGRVGVGVGVGVGLSLSLAVGLG